MDRPPPVVAPQAAILFVQYVDGVQLELPARRASEAKGRGADEVVLLDRNGLLAERYEPEQPWETEAWSGWAWMRLSDVDEHLRRGSLWEALLELEEARALLLRHHAAATGVPDPGSGSRACSTSGRGSAAASAEPSAPPALWGRRRRAVPA